MKTTSIIKLVGLALCAAFLAGCAATGAKYQEVSKSMPAMKAGEGRVYFMRSSSMMGAAIQPDIRLNGQVVGASKPGGFFYVDRPAGSYSASAQTEAEKTLSFSLRPGETKYVRSSISFGIVAGRVVLDLEAADKATAELQTLSYTGAGAGK